MASKKAAPLATRLAHSLMNEHARSQGGVHLGAAGGGCPVCELLREARAAGHLENGVRWPSQIAWDGKVYNGGEQ